MFYLAIVNKVSRHCHSCLARQYLYIDDIASTATQTLSCVLRRRRSTDLHVSACTFAQPGQYHCISLIGMLSSKNCFAYCFSLASWPHVVP